MSVQSTSIEYRILNRFISVISSWNHNWIDEIYGRSVVTIN